MTLSLYTSRAVSVNVYLYPSFSCLSREDWKSRRSDRPMMPRSVALAPTPSLLLLLLVLVLVLVLVLLFAVSVPSIVNVLPAPVCPYASTDAR